MEPQANRHHISKNLPPNSTDQKHAIKSNDASSKPTIAQKSVPINNEFSEIQSKNDQSITQNQEIEGCAFFKIVIENSKQQEEQIELFSNGLNKFEGDNINLEIDSRFENDGAFISFVEAILPYCERVKYFSWIIKGTFADYSSGKPFKNIIEKMKNLFYLNLNFVSRSFGKQAATSLGIGLTKKKQLRIFNFKFQEVTQLKAASCIQEILSAVKTLPNIEIFNHDFRKYFYMGKKQSNLIFDFFYHIFTQFWMSDIADENVWKHALENFCKILDEKSSSLSQVKLINDHYERKVCQNGDSYLNYFEQRINKSEELLAQLIIKCIPLQYLTSFKVVIIEDQTHKNTLIMGEQLRLLAEARMQQIAEIIAFKKICLKYISFNPQQALLDMYYD